MINANIKIIEEIRKCKSFLLHKPTSLDIVTLQVNWQGIKELEPLQGSTRDDIFRALVFFFSTRTRDIIFG